MRHLVTITFLWMSIATVVAANDQDSPLPDAKQVKAISIKFDHPKLDDVEFTATPEDWEAIRAVMLPAKSDPKPALWEWFGTVKITKNDGQPFQVTLYNLPYPTGAFSIGETFYRGGNSADLVKAIIAAYDRSMKVGD